MLTKRLISIKQTKHIVVVHHDTKTIVRLMCQIVKRHGKVHLKRTQ